ncbi:MAG: phosphonopyruvate decarboxylase [Spirochaetaceae bacterium]|nr:phosphonopyruvate decarboxylase [Spirochaetaceae bacterium]
MINTLEFYKALQPLVDFYTGVPDSLLKDFCAYLSDHLEDDRHIIAANEGNSIALAAGHYLATGKPSLVYMQNSGIGNTVNPLLSLMDADVYGIPVLMLIGWRGEPGVKDEPQHVKQGKITLSLLECMGIDYALMDSSSDMKQILTEAEKHLRENLPFAIVVRKNTFSEYKLLSEKADLSDFPREEALKILVNKSESADMFISTTGKISRELFEIREENNQSHSTDFLIVGSMGHTSQIAAGVALAGKKRQIICLDGDGSMLMHMGSLAVNGNLAMKNMIHLVLNNGAHDTVGGQPTVSKNMDLCAIATACGYKKCLSCSSAEELEKALDSMRKEKVLTFIEVKVKKGARDNLGRPTISPVDCKNAFIKEMQSSVSQ